ncbi:ACCUMULATION AND REPLICATION OF CHLOROPLASTS 3, chloroplastic-like protein [Drosera capensis]
METPSFSTLLAVPCRSPSRSSSRSTLLLAGMASNQEYALHPYLLKARIPPPISMKSNGIEGPRLNAASAFNQPFLNDVWRDSRCVEVIGIGSRVDSVFDFCLSLCSSLGSLRFWNAIPGPSLLLKGQLQVKLHEKDVIPASLVAPQELQSLCKAFVLVASAGYGDEHITVSDMLKTVKSACGLVVVIVLSPFSFEGLRRQDESKVSPGSMTTNANGGYYPLSQHQFAREFTPGKTVDRDQFGRFEEHVETRCHYDYEAVYANKVAKL